MTTITNRTTKGSELTYAELDANFDKTAQTKGGAYTVAIGDNRDTIEVSATATITLPDAATIAAASDTGDFEVTIKNSSTGLVTVTCTTVTDTIDDSTADITLAPQEGVLLKVNQAGNGYNRLPGLSITLPVIYDSEGDKVFEFGETASAVTHLKVTNAATGAYPEFSAEGEADKGIVFRDTNGNISCIAQPVSGAGVNYLGFTPAVTGNPPIIAPAGTDTDIDVQLTGKGTGGVFGCLKRSTAITLSGNASETFSDVPSWCKRITVIGTDVDTSSQDYIGIQVGTSGGIVTTGYVTASCAHEQTPTARRTNCILTTWLQQTDSQILGTLVNINGNVWQYGGTHLSDAGGTDYVGTAQGRIDAGGTITQIKFFCAVSASNLNAGTINLIYEG